MKHYAILFNFRGNQVKDDAIIKIFEQRANDWLKYAHGVYLIKTSETAGDWSERLKSFSEPDGNILVMEVNVRNHQGWASKIVREWLSRNQ